MSGKGASKIPITKDEIIKIRQVIDKIEEDPQAFDFTTPVDYKLLGLDDYPMIIKNPMDLGTVKNKLNNNQYPFFQDALNDIQLIWDNCKLFNQEGSVIMINTGYIQNGCIFGKINKEAFRQNIQEDRIQASKTHSTK
jgi:hypothetical protein